MKLLSALLVLLKWTLHFFVVLVLVTLIFCISSLKDASLFAMMLTLNGVYGLSVLYQLSTTSETSKQWPDWLSMSFCLGILILLMLLPILHPNWALTNFLLAFLLGILMLWSLALYIVEEFFSQPTTPQKDKVNDPLCPATRSDNGPYHIEAYPLAHLLHQVTPDNTPAQKDKPANKLRLVSKGDNEKS